MWVTTGVHPKGAVLTVENTGQQLTPQLASTLAEPFQRGTERIRADHAGVGLGLAIVKSITQAHDGTLALTPGTPAGSASRCNYPPRHRAWAGRRREPTPGSSPPKNCALGPPPSSSQRHTQEIMLAAPPAALPFPAHEFPSLSPCPKFLSPPRSISPPSSAPPPPPFYTPAWSRELFAAYGWIGDQLRESSASRSRSTRPGSSSAASPEPARLPVAVGSHLDTVASGGPSTVCSGSSPPSTPSAAARRRASSPSGRSGVVAFMDEEGTRSTQPLFGSRAFTGEDVGYLGDRVDADGVSAPDAIARGRLRPRPRRRSRARRRHRGVPRENHIEQGPVRGRGHRYRRRHVYRRPARLSCAAARPGEPRRYDANHRAATPSPARPGSPSRCATRPAAGKG